MFNLKNTVSYIWPIIIHYKWMFYGIFALQAFRTILNSVVTPIFYKKIVDVISTGGADRMILADPLYKSLLGVAIIIPCAWLFGRATQYFISKFQSAVIKELHNLSFEKLHGHSYTFFTDHFTGSLVNKSRKFVRAFEVMHDNLVDRYWTCLVLLVSVFIVFLIHAPLIAFIFLVMSAIYVLIVLLMSRKKMEYDIAEAAADSKLTGQLADTMTNTLAIKSSSALHREIEEYKESTTKESVLRLRAWLFGNKINAIQAGITMSVQILVVFVTGYLWLTGKISAGLFVLVQSYSNSIANNFWELGQATTKFTKGLSDMKEMVDIFKEVPDVLDPSDPEKSRIKDGVIEMKGVNFSYLNGTKVFKDFSLQIHSGEKVGLVGHSGSGKSTITKLLMRFIDISSGAILIDGQDIRNITQDDLHRNISYISQEPILFHRSIRDNISYSFPGATEEQIVSAAKRAHAHEFVSNLPYGYDTLVGERGIKLSGGERQRVAIARAMLKPSPILVLDEATSSLDSISESYIQDAFNELMKEKTSIVIAHRLSTVQKMDRIIVLEKGVVVEEGTHRELLEKKGFYADLWEHQTGGFLE